MGIRTNIESLVADALAASLSATLGADFTDAAPVVAWHDPMSIDDANRVIVMVPSCQSSEELGPGNYECTIEIGVKSQWAQPSLADDKAAHFARVESVRDALNDYDVIGAIGGDDFGINFISPRQNHTTKIVEGFYYSETSLTVHIWTKENNG